VSGEAAATETLSKQMGVLPYLGNIEPAHRSKGSGRPPDATEG